MQFDYIVIGSGSGGSAVAGRLAEDGRSRVLVLEAGGSDRRLPVLMPAATYLYAIGNPRFDWRLNSQPDPSRGGRTDYMPRGKVLGGSSSINGMLYVRGQPEDFDGWAMQGCAGWEFERVRPYFRRAEDNENGADEDHGTGGPLSVQNLRTSHPLSDAFLRAGVEAGLEATPDINRPPQGGIGYLQATQKNGWRCSAARAYLWRRRPNLTVMTHAQARRILFDGTRASGVTFDHKGKTVTAHAAKAVVLSAGAFGSPQLLMLSGVGPQAQLREHGIDVVHDLPGVGENFHDHPGTSHIVWVDQPTYNVQHTLRHALLYGAMWLFAGRGPGTTPDAHVMAFTRSSPELARCDLEFHFTPVGYDLTETGPILFDKPAVTALNNIHRPHSRGHVRLASTDPFAAPAIQPNLLGDARDVDTLVAGAKRLRAIFEAPAMARHVLGEFKPGREVQTDDEWAGYVRESAIGIYHPAGTCKMGVDPMAVVDPTLKVRGLDNLYVADASIMPVIVSGNLNANCIMIGERCADFIKAA
ncbi:GMC family oxidoreductase N-terminal domain-containing protein [Starkeya koreensis]|uniref:GMC family oxidoreductase N-terminal domain-containing protein n=1 Tax=Ancylobacter koreensis TaxID=266121 RepID=A0ABT0DHK0_9HYPH|nr:GMC family oxidoreductase N-terminal domain-containing protein [Ancylobacter koreensis]MCK0206750.1 GMC family oxidoreductase N-terminal domain-containing protein [Ancylobacter koreensis]